MHLEAQHFAGEHESVARRQRFENISSTSPEHPPAARQTVPGFWRTERAAALSARPIR
jgi:hypothetical protein